ncbi:MAG: hypothetical protein IJ226_03040, partial [Clostridia bacterium]|nr:hypothetical protein [Clostridia bacterium]
ATTQKAFEEMGLAATNAVDVYKQIKIEQVNRMFAGQKSLDDNTAFDASGAVASINAATTFQGVSDAYFDAIRGYLPKYC